MLKEVLMATTEDKYNILIKKNRLLIIIISNKNNKKGDLLK